MKKIIEDTRTGRFQDPEFPRFIMVDRSGNYVFGVLGYVSSTLYYDAGGLEEDDFETNKIVIPNSAHELDRIGIKIGGSRLGFKLIGDDKYGRVVAYIETDFGGTNNNLQLKHAYVQFRGFTIGKTWSTFVDLDSPSIIDGQGPSSMSGSKVPLLRYKFKLSKRSSLSIAAELPEVSVYDKGTVYYINQRFPDLPIVYTYNTDKFDLFGGLSMRTLRYRDFSAEIEQKVSLALTLSMKYKFLKNNTFYVQGIFEDGMANYIQDIGSMGLDLIYGAGEVKTLAAGGYYVGYTRNWDSKSSSTAVFSQTFVENNNRLSKEVYSQARYFAVNYIRKFFHYATFGGEFLYGFRKNIDGSSGEAYRFNVLVRYDF